MAKDFKVAIEIFLKDTASSGIKAIGDAVTGMLTVAAVKQVAELAVELANLGSESLITRARFEAFAGSAEEADRTIRLVKEATNDTISEMGAMQGASKLFQMGLVGSAEEAAFLMEAAVKLGDQTQDTSGRVEDFALMLANTSIPRLDNFGISSGRVRTRIKELQDQMPGLSRETAFMQATMEEAQKSLELLEDAGLEQMQGNDRLKSSFQDLKATVGEEMAPSLQLLTGGLADLVSGFDDFLNRSDLAQIFLEKMSTSSNLFLSAAETGKAYTEMLINNAQQSEINATAQQALNDANLEYVQVGEQAIGVSGMLRNKALELETADLRQEEAIRQVSETMASAPEAMDQYNQAIEASRQASMEAETAQREHKDAIDALRVSQMNAKAAFDETAASLGELNKQQMANAQIEALAEAREKGEISAKQFAEAQNAILKEMGLLTQAEEEAQNRLNKLREDYIGGRIDAEDYAKGVDVIGDTMEEISEQEKKTKAELEKLNTEYEDGKITSEEYKKKQEELKRELDSFRTETMQEMRPQLENLNQEFEDGAGDVETMAGSMDDGKQAAGEFRGELDELSTSIEELPEEKRIRITYEVEVTGDEPPSGSNGSGGGATPMQSGFNGIVSTPTQALFGEWGPEYVNVQPLERTTVNNNFNTTINTSATQSNVLSDLQQIQAIYGRR